MTEPEFSRPATLDDLKLLLQSLRDQGADYLLVGGYALAAHGNIGLPMTSIYWFRLRRKQVNM